MESSRGDRCRATNDCDATIHLCDSEQLNLCIERVFNDLFREDYRTALSGGHPEPEYRPASDLKIARLCYREDYPSSALHEAAHWCIAGTSRRAQTDFGYQYIHPPRTYADQTRFFNFECRVQALESVFAEAAGVNFCVSADDIESAWGSSAGDAEDRAQQRIDFASAVANRVKPTERWMQTSAGERARCFYAALNRHCRR